jgi:hypothetical protein
VLNEAGQADSTDFLLLIMRIYRSSVFPNALFKDMMLKQAYKARQIAWNTQNLHKHLKMLIGAPQLNLLEPTGCVMQQGVYHSRTVCSATLYLCV